MTPDTKALIEEARRLIEINPLGDGPLQVHEGTFEGNLLDVLCRLADALEASEKCAAAWSDRCQALWQERDESWWETYCIEADMQHLREKLRQRLDMTCIEGHRFTWGDGNGCPHCLQGARAKLRRVAEATYDELHRPIPYWWSEEGKDQYLTKRCKIINAILAESEESE